MSRVEKAVNGNRAKALANLERKTRPIETGKKKAMK
jgi:hypothetical protein